MNISTFFLIILVLALFWIIGFLINKYFILPFFFIPKLFLNELLKFLDKNGCIYVEHKNLTKKDFKRNKNIKDLNFVEKMYSMHSDYIVIAYSKKENVYKMYWLRIMNNFLYFFGKRSLRFTLEDDKEINRKLQEEYAAKISVVTDACPACKAKITKNESKCSSCGLTINE